MFLEYFLMFENIWYKLTSGLRTDPPEGIEAAPLDQKCCHWQATITGPVGSPYEGGLFYLYLQIPYSYPMCPPIVRFLTRIFHPNVSRHGHVGIDSIQHNWSLALTISKVLISVQSLLTDPYCQVCCSSVISHRVLYSVRYNVRVTMRGRRIPPGENTLCWNFSGFSTIFEI